MFLPTEVLDYILSFLQSEVDTLEACAQSHPILSQVVERFLYANLIIHDEIRSPNNNSYGLRIVDLRKLLSDRPHISNYVQNLTICVRFPAGHYFLEISAILPRLLALRTLTLCVVGDQNYPWQMLPQAFRSAFLDFLNQRPPKEVSIGRFSSVPLSLLDRCEIVKSITLDGCFVVYPKCSRNQPGSITLDHLSIRGCNAACLENVITWVKLPWVRVQSLTFMQPYEQQELNIFPQVLSGCSNSLTSLNLDILDAYQSLFKFSKNTSTPLYTLTMTSLTLSTIPHLKNLIIRSRASLGHSFIRLVPNVPCWDHNSIIPAIVQLLTTPPPSLKQLTLEFDFALQGTPPSGAIWSPFISLMAQCSSLDIKVNIVARFTRQKLSRGIQTVPLPAISSSLAECRGLMRYVEQGVLIVIPRE